MTKQQIIQAAENFTDHSKDNYISEEIAISQKSINLRMYEMPIFAFASAEDAYFYLLKEPYAIGEHFMLPSEWLPGAKTVISFFLPFSLAVREGNKEVKDWPSEEWLHGRIEGQSFLNSLCLFLKSQLNNAGYDSVVPSLEPGFFSNMGRNKHPEKTNRLFTSNWSERHVAFVCGLGTFGLSKGLITRKGVAGRFGSIVTRLTLSPDNREYEGIDEYCNKCGKCAVNCPVGAISVEKGKDHSICSDYLDVTLEKFNPRYGCGKCQVNVPCENKIPQKGDKVF